MLVGKITQHSSITKTMANQSNNQTNYTQAIAKANNTDICTFTARTPRILPEEIINMANIVAEKFRTLTKAADDASLKLGRTNLSKKEREAAQAIIDATPKVLTAKATILGKEQTCKAELGQYFEGCELCIDVPNGGKTLRYRLKLDKNGNVTTKSRLDALNVDEKIHYYSSVDLSKRKKYDNAVNAVRTLLTALSK